MNNLRVVPGRNVVASHLVGKVQQRAKLHHAVAQHAGVGGEAVLIGGDKALDHVAVKGFAAVDHMVLKAQSLGDGARVLNVRHVVAGPALAASRAARVVQAHGGTNAFVPLLKQQVGGHAGVDAAAHGDHTRFLRPIPFVAAAAAAALVAADASFAVLFADKVGERVIRAFLIKRAGCLLRVPVESTR